MSENQCGGCRRDSMLHVDMWTPQYHMWLERNSSLVVTHLNGFTSGPSWDRSGPRAPYRSPSAAPLKDPLHLWCLGTVSGSPPDLWLTLPFHVAESVRYSYQVHQTARPASRASDRTDRSTGYEPKAIVLGGSELKSSYFFFLAEKVPYLSFQQQPWRTTLKW